MPFVGGQRIGPYEIVAPLGAGGMGVVYRARDTRLGREVAIKVLPDDFASDAGRLSRFELEARAVAALSHPNILAVHDVGTHEGAPYLVMELLDGQTVRERLASGPIPVRKAIEYAVQMAQGLAAAHEKGIVHRDVKPENVFITRDGRLKLLDFGLAKADDGAAGVATGTLPQSQSGAVLGTAGYMAPEQVQGKPADARSDLFALGVVLYEMLTGKRAFEGPTPVERGYAILNTDPADFAHSGVAVPVAVERIVRQCLEKSREARFQSAHDLGFALAALADTSGSGRTAPLAAKRRWWPYVVGGALVVGGLAVGVGVGRSTREPPVATLAASLPRFTRVSFRDGMIAGARFGPDGRTIFYAAAFGGEPWQTWATTVGKPDARPVGPAWHSVLDVSRGGDLLLGRRQESRFRGNVGQVVSVLDANAGTPREQARDVAGASLGPDGRSIAIVRRVGLRRRLEYPIGTTLLEGDEGEGLWAPRVRPAGDTVALGVARRGEGFVELVSTGGKRRRLSGPWRDLDAPVWSADGNEVWFSASRGSEPASIWAVTTGGREREVLTSPGGLRLADLSRDGRALVVRSTRRVRVMAGQRGDPRETDVSWFDHSGLFDLSADGRSVLLLEGGEAAAVGGALISEAQGFLRSTSGSSAVRVSDFPVFCLSPDATWAAGVRDRFSNDAGVGYTLVPTGPGEPRNLPRGSLEVVKGGICSRDGQHVVFVAAEKGHGDRLWVQAIDGGLPQAISAEGVVASSAQTSPDGRLVTVLYDDGGTSIISVDASEERALKGFPRNDVAVDWDADGGALFVRRAPTEALPVRVDRYELATGRRTPWLELSPDPTGIDPHEGVRQILLTAQGHYVYAYDRESDVLYSVDGLQESHVIP